MKDEIAIDRCCQSWSKVEGHLGEVGTLRSLFGVYAGNQGVEQRNPVPGFESFDLIWVVGICCGVRITIYDVLGMSA